MPLLLEDPESEYPRRSRSHFSRYPLNRGRHFR